MAHGTEPEREQEECTNCTVKSLPKSILPLKVFEEKSAKAHQTILKEEKVLCGYCFGFYKEEFLSYHISLMH